MNPTSSTPQGGGEVALGSHTTHTPQLEGEPNEAHLLDTTRQGKENPVANSTPQGHPPLTHSPHLPTMQYTYATTHSNSHGTRPSAHTR